MSLQKNQKEEEEDSDSNCDENAEKLTSIFNDPTLTSELRGKRQRSVSPEPSGVSQKSDWSMVQPPLLSDAEVTSDPSVSKRKTPKSASPEPSGVSLKSDWSMVQPPLISDAEVTSDLSISKRKTARSTSPEPSCVSLKSDWSMVQPPLLSDAAVTKMGEKQEMIRSLSSSTSHCKCNIRQDISETVLLTEDLQSVKEQHKTIMRNKYQTLFEGNKLQENRTLLSKIYTQLYIIEGESEGVNEEHEVSQMEKTARTKHSQHTPIYCNDIFKEEKGQIKTVITKGIAGIGKTVSVQKFILDWAEGKANEDVDFMFVLPFRELNMIPNQQCCLHGLLLDFHPELQYLEPKIYEECKVVFIFDGLDESRIKLKFSDSKKVCNVTETSSVAVLMSKLIEGELLPSAHIWITSRPAAANQIPSKYIKRLTEIQGFTEPQKEEYFRKRISDEHQASRIISHIRRARSLHIMCHIPVFCWISSTVLQKLLEDLSAEIPQTLTEMYIHFLLIQINTRNQKYEESGPEKPLQSNREVIVKLAEVAFKQLMKGNVMFYEEDLIKSGIDLSEASVYSGICTEIFKEESLINQRKVYSFIHLSVQEFLAAFYAFYYHLCTIMKTLTFFALHNLLKAAVDAAIKSENGHLDLFLRFLLGVSLESNQTLLQDLLTHTEKSSDSINEIIQYIKEKIRDGHGLSTERSINLFLCLLEVKDQTLSREIQEFVKSNKRSEKKLSPAHCSTIAYMLQMAEEVLDELDVHTYNTSDEGRRRLLPVVSNCKRALFPGCCLIARHCEVVSSALQSLNCVLKELDLSNNDLQDSGVKLLSDGLKNPNCQLEILRLSGCMVTEEGCGFVSSALNSNPSHLRELDLSYNDPGQSGVWLLKHKLEDPHYKLEKLNVDHGGKFMMRAGLRKYAVDLTLDLNTVNSYVMLSEDNRKITHVKEMQPYPDHPDRFDAWYQVLCEESLTGRCYWEVEWNGWAYMAVSYKGINRKGGRECRFGRNEKSWILFCSSNRFTVCHDNNFIDIGVPSPLFNRVGVYLDVPAGILSYYSVSDTHTLTHLYTYHTTFTEDLYAGFRVYESSMTLCQI